MFQDFEKSEQMFSNIWKIVTTYIVQSEMFRNKIYRVNNFQNTFELIPNKSKCFGTI